MTYLREWSPRDRGLAEGLLTLEGATGPHGIPTWIANDPEAGTWLEVEEDVDHAQAALDTWQQGQTHPTPGLFPRLVDTRTKHDEQDDDLTPE
jgi:hypothetical protein